MSDRASRSEPASVIAGDVAGVSDWMLSPQDESEITALIRAIKRANGFSLLFVKCDRIGVRDATIARVEHELPELDILELTVPPQTSSLLEFVIGSTDEENPDAIFLTGIEFWLPAIDEASTTPLVVGLNNTRNSFPDAIKKPLVIWCPGHVLTTIARGAPDFFAVRSAVYAVAGERSILDIDRDSESWDDFSFTEREQRLNELLGRLNIYKSLPPEQQDNLTAASLERSVGNGYLELGLYNEAEQMLRNALAIAEGELGTEHIQLAGYLNLLGIALIHTRDLQGAREIFERSLRLQEDAYGADDPEIIAALNNVGSLLREQGDIASAQAAFERALGITEAAYGPFHPDISTSANNMGVTFSHLGDLASAYSQFDRALRVDELVHGSNHPNIAADLNNLGWVLQKLGDLQGASAAYERALNIAGAVYGTNNPRVATMLNNIGFLYRDRGDLARAHKAFERAYQIYASTLGENHASTIRAKERLDNQFQAT